MGNMEYIRKTYGVPAKRGARVKYTGGKEPCFGSVTSSDGCYLRIKMDDEKHTGLYHPTWKIEYIAAAQEVGSE